MIPLRTSDSLSMKLQIFLGLIAGLCLQSCLAQFPRVCVKNATTPDGICCPTRPGDTLNCGGPQRGMCRRISVMNEVDLVPLENRVDDRFNWPSRFFKMACECRGNYDGYMCQHCSFGFTGPECTKKLRRIRKDYRKLTNAEKQDLLRGILLLDQTDSDYAVLDTTVDADPSVAPKFVNVSIYNYLAYYHYYVSRHTLVKPLGKCQNLTYIPDLAHAGPAFCSWHRAYLLLWEMELANILKKPDFSFPYWNWTLSGKNCDVCTNDFMGKTSNLSDGTLDESSFFSKFKVRCVPTDGGCTGCNPLVDSGDIIRRPGANFDYQYLPNQTDINYLMLVSNYDALPYDRFSGNMSFRNLLEGFGDKNGPTGERMVTHNQVHAYMDGTFSELATAAYDPIFQLHHAFIDKLLEIWLRDNKPALSELPEFEANAGHNRMTNMVPFFPVRKNYLYFAHSHSLGYDYDSLAETTVPPRVPLNPVWIIVIVEAGLVLLLIVVIIELARKRSRSSSASRRFTSTHNNETAAGVPEEEQPIFRPGDPSYSTYNAAET